MTNEKQSQKEEKQGGSDEALRCSFCNKSQREVKKLVAGPTVFICDDCVEICVDIIAEDRMYDTAKKSRLSLEAVREKLDRTVVGQPGAKRALSAALTHHAVSAAAGIRSDWSKGHILLAGPTGSGKSFLVRTLAEHLALPLATADATRLTGESYFQEQDPFARLLERAGNDQKRAETGVVVIDQIDRVACQADDETAARRLQESLLSLLDGTVTSFKTSLPNNLPAIERTVDTSGILFILSGTFRGLERANRGGVASESEISEEDLVAWGLMPELVARLGTLCSFDRLAAADLAAILRLPEHSLLNEYLDLFLAEGVELTFDDGAIEAIAQVAARRGGGARSLRSVLEAVALAVSFADASGSSPDRNLRVDEGVVRRSLA